MTDKEILDWLERNPCSTVTSRDPVSGQLCYQCNEHKTGWVRGKSIRDAVEKVVRELEEEARR